MYFRYMNGIAGVPKATTFVNPQMETDIRHLQNGGGGGGSWEAGVHMLAQAGDPVTAYNLAHNDLCCSLETVKVILHSHESVSIHLLEPALQTSASKISSDICNSGSGCSSRCQDVLVQHFQGCAITVRIEAMWETQQSGTMTSSAISCISIAQSCIIGLICAVNKWWQVYPEVLFCSSLNP